MPTLRQAAVAACVRRYPLYSGCGRLANHALVQRLAGPSCEEVAWARLPGGQKIAVPLDDYVGRAVYFAGELDRKITWICRRLVRPGDTVVDVGANLGLVTFTLARLVGPGGRVEAFEPIPRMQQLIDQGIRRNRLDNVHLHRVALGAAAAELTLSVPRHHAGSATFLVGRRSAESDEVTVPVTTLSDALPTAREPVRLIKIDVEGFEPEVLAGAEEYFARTRPEAVLFELNERPEAGRARSLDILDKYGYDFAAVPRCRFRMRLHPVDPDGPIPIDVHDFLAVRRGPVAGEVWRRVRVAHP